MLVPCTAGCREDVAEDVLAAIRAAAESGEFNVAAGADAEGEERFARGNNRLKPALMEAEADPSSLLVQLAAAG